MVRIVSAPGYAFSVELCPVVSTESETIEMCPSEEPKTDELTNQDSEDSVSDYDVSCVEVARILCHFLVLS